MRQLVWSSVLRNTLQYSALAVPRTYMPAHVRQATWMSPMINIRLVWLSWDNNFLMKTWQKVTLPWQIIEQGVNQVCVCVCVCVCACVCACVYLLLYQSWSAVKRYYRSIHKYVRGSCAECTENIPIIRIRSIIIIDTWLEHIRITHWKLMSRLSELPKFKWINCLEKVKGYSSPSTWSITYFLRWWPQLHPDLPLLCSHSWNSGLLHCGTSWTSGIGNGESHTRLTSHNLPDRAEH